MTSTKGEPEEYETHAALDEGAAADILRGELTRHRDHANGTKAPEGVLQERIADTRANPATEKIRGDSREMKAVRRMISRISRSDIGVFIMGESGTGKELVAKALHASSERVDGPFVAINCAAMPAHLLESELFGHVSGAFTGARRDRTGLFQQADGGTLFLDEIGEMPLEMQPKLLRAVETKRVRPVGADEDHGFDARVIAATNIDIQKAVEAGHFREDLYFRLNVVSITLPPLRQRGQDILLLAEQFARDEAHTQGRPLKGLSQAAAKLLLEHSWPGNVRELANAMTRAIAMARDPSIMPDDLPPAIREGDEEARSSTHSSSDLISLEALEQTHIERVLNECGWKRAEAASILGIDRRTLYRKIRRYDLH